MAAAGRVSLITGASEGIGAELARIFASRGHRVAIVARRVDLLERLASDIARPGAPSPLVIGCDLALPDAGERIAAALAAAGVEPDHVVNNAGFGLYGEAAALPLADQLALVDVNVRALSDLSLRFAAPLIRHRGGILNVASVAAFLPGPRMAAYYASKAYVLSFTEALHHELAPRGVRVTVLCPGPVPSGFQARAGFAPGGRLTLLACSAAQVARAGYDGMMAGRRLVVPGLANKLVTALVRFMPRGAVLSGVGFVQRNRE